jgi:hypothetical protein
MTDFQREIELAWAAGIFEGEGTIYVHETVLDSGAKGKLSTRMLMGMSDEDVVLRFQRIVGCGTITVRPPNKDHNKTMYSWRTNSRKEFLTVGMMLSSHFGVRRASKYKEAIDLIFDGREDGRVAANKRRANAGRATE